MKKQILYQRFVCGVLAFLMGVVNADFNVSVPAFYPDSMPDQAAAEKTSFYGGGSDEDDFPKPGGFPNTLHSSALWLVPVLQYLLVIENDSLMPIKPVTVLLPVLLSTGISYWFAGEQVETIARQNGYPLQGHAFPFEHLAASTVPILEAPRQIRGNRAIITGSGTNGEGTSDQPERHVSGSQNFSGGQGGGEGEDEDEDEDEDRKSNHQEWPFPFDTVYVVYKNITVNGQTYEIKAYLTGENEKLYCPVCLDLVNPDAIICTTCNRTKCKKCPGEASATPKQNKCSICRGECLQKAKIQELLAGLLWECPQCKKEFTEANIHIHLATCGPLFGCEFPGCPATGGFTQIQQHEQICGFRPEECLNQGCTTSMLRRHRTHHIALCPYARISVHGTRIQGPRFRVDQINRAIAVTGEAQDSSDDRATILSEGLMLLLEIAMEMVEEIPEATPQAITSPENVGQSTYTCDVCHLEQMKRDEFHKAYCQPVFLFRNLRLNRTQRGGELANEFITYYGNNYNNVYFFVRPNVFCDDITTIELVCSFQNRHYSYSLYITDTKFSFEYDKKYSLSIHSDSGDIVIPPSTFEGKDVYHKYKLKTPLSIPNRDTVLVICVSVLFH